MADHVIHISEAEAASDFGKLLERVRAGAEVVIESDKLPVAVLRPAEPHVRLLSDSLRLAKEHASAPHSTRISPAMWKPRLPAIGRVAHPRFLTFIPDSNLGASRSNDMLRLKLEFFPNLKQPP